MKIAVIGYGSIGKRHVQNLLSIPDTEIIICTKQKIKNPSTKNVKIVKSISDCIKEKPKVGIIANESSFHIQIAMKLAKSGMDLFIEKPLSNSFFGTKELVRIIKKKKIITQMGCQFRFHRCIKEIKHMISTCKLGKVISVSAECGSFLPEWHPHEDYTKSYAAREDLGGGVVLTNIHEIDYLYWFFGDVSKVFSITGKFSELKISADDLCVGILQFKNKVIAELHLDYFQKPDFRSCKIIGTKGTVIWDSDTNNVMFYDNKKNKWVKILKWTRYDRNSMFKEEIIHFLHCVKKRETTINPVEKDGVNTLKIALSIIKSSKSRRVVKT
ncbi:dehydrogenase [Nitrosopumilus zosterae]|uniref:Dehydrogenase n=1 Tax=Nitrosopumilus zosterae TaxID=718286 RepID=A0A2S2KUB3_9ARCH|nr:Gfo/Idh/MocA family oxidoreductase [Nitrosopumilus zosterae]BDQ31831.1 Gfo/Idh/MocA family oxidoreductase [Nitrosopumilus zosterae]GBH35181.1 dehydrogenase [Nitrosopumilus zosterae]